MRYPVFIFVFLFCVSAAKAQNEKPEIVGQKDLSTGQGQPIAIQLTDLYVEEQDDPGGDHPEGEDPGGNNGSGGQDDKGGKPDKGHKGDKGPKGDKGDKGDKGNKGHKGNGRTLYPEGYALLVSGGKHYTVSGTTVIPDDDFTGVLVVGVQVKNEKYKSTKFDLKITVTPAELPNVPPVITGQLPLSTKINSPVTVSLPDLTVTDPDDAYPSGFTLKIFQGDHYTAAEDVVTPDQGFTGTLTVKVSVSDGTNDSEPYDLKIEVSEKDNVRPAILGQIPLSISVNQTITVVLSQLDVNDPDSRYPGDFLLNLFPGEHYTLSGSTVTPDKDFSGQLYVKVSVNDGNTSSEVYDLKITVMPGPDTKPVITGQAGLKIAEGQSLEITFRHLTVEDPDSQYPEDFSLEVSEGEHYSVTRHLIIPEEGFVGILHAAVAVNDGKLSSDPFDLKIEIIAKDRLEILSQKSLEIPEDSSLTLNLADLIVNDPDHEYPSGYSLQIGGGENYEVSNGVIKPRRDYFGNLTIPVTINTPTSASPAFSLLLTVTPVNDAPVLTNLEPSPLVMSDTEPVVLTASIEASDVDDDHLLYAEVAFDREHYQVGKDKLIFESPEDIHGVFEADTGVLFLFGRASILEYQNVLRSVKYIFAGSPDSVLAEGSMKITFKVNDGKTSSDTRERLLLSQSGGALEIPSGFTPNNDMANDTWKITPLKAFDGENTHIRVFDKKGNMVFQTTGLDTEWDGQFNGSPLPADVYFYTIDLDLSYRKANYKGIVSILR